MFIVYVRCFLKAALWISDTPAVLEEYVQCVSKVTDLKTLLSSKKYIGKLSNTEISMYAMYSTCM